MVCILKHAMHARHVLGIAWLCDERRLKTRRSMQNLCTMPTFPFLLYDNTRYIVDHPVLYNNALSVAVNFCHLARIFDYFDKLN
jgi:hypothetical protein